MSYTPHRLKLKDFTTRVTGNIQALANLKSNRDPAEMRLPRPQKPKSEDIEKITQHMQRNQL